MKEVFSQQLLTGSRGVEPPGARKSDGQNDQEHIDGIRLGKVRSVRQAHQEIGGKDSDCQSDQAEAGYGVGSD